TASKREGRGPIFAQAHSQGPKDLTASPPKHEYILAPRKQTYKDLHFLKLLALIQSEASEHVARSSRNINSRSKSKDLHFFPPSPNQPKAHPTTRSDTVNPG
ncbi:MAG TPA: hypothetical protein VHX60_10350, partial [Acidobacteriaceae bacterium]|nr:hypothetical protein [Acidobacteriaceae bacterium]